MMTDTRKTVAIAFVFSMFAFAPASANVADEETSNATTLTAATNNQQTNIVSTIVGGATSTVRITTVTTTTTGPAARVDINISVPQGGLNPGGVPAGGTVTITTSSGATVQGTVNADGSITIPIEGGGSTTVQPDGTVVEVNDLGHFDNTQNASIEQFGFDRSNGFKSTQSGASAGGVDGKLSIWVNGGYSTFDEDQVAIDADGDTWTLGVGADWQFSERFVAGLSLSGSLSDVTTTFNDGSVETTGYTISPYFVTILGADKNILIDGAFGYSINDNDSKRSFGTITSAYDSSSWFVSGNATYIFTRGKFRVSPKVGVLWLDNTTDGYTESAGLVIDESGSKLGRLSAGVRLDYTKYAKFTPFISFTGEYDFESADYSTFTGSNRPSVEDTGAILGAGFSTQLSEKVSGDISGTTALGRDKYQAYTLSGTLRFNF